MACVAMRKIYAIDAVRSSPHPMGFIARVRSNGMLGENVERAICFKRRVGRRLFACPPIRGMFRVGRR